MLSRSPPFLDFLPFLAKTPRLLGLDFSLVHILKVIFQNCILIGSLLAFFWLNLLKLLFLLYNNICEDNEKAIFYYFVFIFYLYINISGKGMIYIGYYFIIFYNIWFYFVYSIIFLSVY